VVVLSSVTEACPGPRGGGEDSQDIESAAAAAAAAGAPTGTDPAAAISMGLVSVSSPDVSSVSEASGKDAPTQRPLCSAAGARLSVSSLLAAGGPMSSSASVPNLSSREASCLMEAFVRRAPNMSRTNATNNMNLSRSSSDNNTNTLGRNALSTASEY
jgi:E3 ubiquitin-protein ligase HECTD1